MSDPSNLKRVAFSPGEFASLFGKSQTWGYRQIYAGKVTAITEHGRILIPANEVERILETAGIYDGKPRHGRTKELPPDVSAEKQSVWQKFVELRRQKNAHGDSAKSIGPRSASADDSPPTRRRALLSGAWKKKGKV